MTVEVPATPAATPPVVGPGVNTPPSTPPAATTPATPPTAPLDIPGEQPPAVPDAWAGVQVDDPAEKLFLDFLGKNKYTPDSPAVKAAQTGDFTLLKAELAQKGVQGYEAVVALAEATHKRVVDAQAAVAEATKKDVIQIFGDEATWNQVRDWAGKNATDEERAYFNDAFAQGGIAAQAAAHLLKTHWQGAEGVTKLPASPKERESAAASSNQHGPLSPDQYAAAVRELANANGGDPARNPAAYNALKARRRLWK